MLFVFAFPPSLSLACFFTWSSLGLYGLRPWCLALFSLTWFRVNCVFVVVYKLKWLEWMCKCSAAVQLVCRFLHFPSSSSSSSSFDTCSVIIKVIFYIGLHRKWQAANLATGVFISALQPQYNLHRDTQSFHPSFLRHLTRSGLTTPGRWQKDQHRFHQRLELLAHFCMFLRTITDGWMTTWVNLLLTQL